MQALAAFKLVGVEAYFLCGKIVCDFSVVVLRFRLKFDFVDSTSYEGNYMKSFPIRPIKVFTRRLVLFSRMYIGGGFVFFGSISTDPSGTSSAVSTSKANLLVFAGATFLIKVELSRVFFGLFPKSEFSGLSFRFIVM